MHSPSPVELLVLSLVVELESVLKKLLTTPIKSDFSDALVIASAAALSISSAPLSPSV
jgi:hypothetical protein